MNVPNRFPQSFEEASPSISDPSWQNGLLVVSNDISARPQLLDGIEHSLADRFVVDTTEAGTPHRTFGDGSAWKSLDGAYRKHRCTTLPKDFFAEIDFAEEDELALVRFILPLAASGRRHEAILARAEYAPKSFVTRTDKTIRRLGRSMLEQPRLGKNPYFVAAPAGEHAKVSTGKRIVNNAARGGRLGGTKL